MNSKITEYIIVGQGLAGTVAAFSLLKAGKKVLVFDEKREFTASKVAAGMFNPINPKRMVKNWNAEVFIPEAIATYRSIEEFLGVSLLHEMPVHTVFGSAKEVNDFSAQMEKDEFSRFVDEHADTYPQISAPLGAITISPAGWLNIPALLTHFSNYLLQNGLLINERLEHEHIRFENGRIHYKNLQSRGILFCEGYRYKRNPFFDSLPCEPTKGDVLTIHCEQLPHDRIIKKGVYLVPLGNNMYKVGATYDRFKLDEEPDLQAKEQLIHDLKSLLNVPFTVLKHESGIRPTMRGRKPFVLQHLLHKQVFILNGLGSKGVMFAPHFANTLVKLILEFESAIADYRV
ncbi:MAG: NAD(P)/FAD-dependent oxidoreductase [Bacteroidota bacterium]|jgi:glycine oxidase